MVEHAPPGRTLAHFDVDPDGRMTARWDDAADAIRCLGYLVGRVESMQSKGLSPGHVEHQGGQELRALRASLIARATAPRSLLERAQLAAVGLTAPDVGARFADEDEVRELKLQLLGAEDEDRAAEAIAAKDVTAELSRWAAQVMPAAIPLDPDGPAARRRPSPAALAYERERFHRSLAGEE
jgi:hypothetical protein